MDDLENEYTIGQAIEDLLAGRVRPESKYRITTDDAGMIIESPIEEDALFGFSSHGFFMLCRFETVAEMRKALVEKCGNKQRLLVAPQVKVGPYRADFLVGRVDRGSVELFAFECDGREFHGRTETQIDRDRRRDTYFAQQGITVARYSGSDLARDPQKCVFEFASKHGLSPNKLSSYNDEDDDEV